MPPRVAEAQASKDEDGKERPAIEVIDAQAIQETAARTVRGAQQIFGNLTGWVREAQSAVADSLSGLAEEGGPGPLAAILRRGERNHEAGGNVSPTASKRKEASINDAAQYFVEYKGLDPALVEELQGPTRKP
ncbi:unnamed protein product [Durusdinium trenchii]|uniref:Uncharacterized protein n=2 Tax=Durusdinium trenchii TaxID=1381693 RepID=A0ABP0QTV2_9DINO